MTVTERAWANRIALLVIAGLCIVGHAPKGISYTVLALLGLNLVLFNPWTLRIRQAREDAEPKTEEDF